MCTTSHLSTFLLVCQPLMRAFSENRRNSEEFSVYGTNDKSSLGIVLLVFVHLCPRLFFHLWLYPAMYFFSLRGGGCQIFPRGCGSQLFQTLWGILRKHKFCLTGNRSDFLWKVWSWNRRGCENKGAWWLMQTNQIYLVQSVCEHRSKFWDPVCIHTVLNFPPFLLLSGMMVPPHNLGESGVFAGEQLSRIKKCNKDTCGHSPEYLL